LDFILADYLARPSTCGFRSCEQRVAIDFGTAYLASGIRTRQIPGDRNPSFSRNLDSDADSLFLERRTGRERMVVVTPVVGLGDLHCILDVDCHCGARSARCLGVAL